MIRYQLTSTYSVFSISLLLLACSGEPPTSAGAIRVADGVTGGPSELGDNDAALSADLPKASEASTPNSPAASAPGNQLGTPEDVKFVGSHVAGVFVHPGTRGSATELAFVKTQVALNAEPWSEHLLQAESAGGDAQALGSALAWYLTDDEAAAERAVAALNGWIGTAAYEPAPEGQGNQSSLEGAWAASVLGPAADILSTYDGWNDEDRAAVGNMFRTTFLPALEQMSYWNGNCDLTQIDALLSIAVFLEDEAAFQRGIERLNRRLPAYFYLQSDDASARTYGGSSEQNWEDPNPVDKWVDGLTQETCRDNLHHAQFAIAAALAAMETAWLQGVDVYSPHEDRMVAALELMGSQLTSGIMQGTCVDNDTNTDRYNTLEIGYNHYHSRMGIELPETRKAIVEELRGAQNQFNMFHETLTHGDIEY